MGKNSKIEWTDHSWSPWHGCTKVSPACDHCYAESFSRRIGFSETGSKFPIWGKDSKRRFFGDDHWDQPLKWNREAEKLGVRFKVFPSMCDPMEEHPDLPHSRSRLFNLIEDTPNLDWLLLTKRPQNFRRFLPKTWLDNPRPNLWGGATVESEEYLWRATELLKTPLVRRFISYEPAIGAVDFHRIQWDPLRDGDCPTLDWIIAGGESGPGARPARAEWVQSVRDQCAAAHAAFFFKQWGDWLPAHQDGARVEGEPQVMNSSDEPIRVGKAKAGALLDGREWRQIPESLA